MGTPRPDGTRLFLRFLDSLLADEANACAIDSTGGVYVAGRTLGYLSTFSDPLYNPTVNSYWDAYVAHFDSIGTLSWVRQVDISYQHNAGLAVKVDSS